MSLDLWEIKGTEQGRLRPPCPSSAHPSGRRFVDTCAALKGRVRVAAIKCRSAEVGSPPLSRRWARRAFGFVERQSRATENPPTKYRRNTDVIPTWFLALFLTATPALAIDVPSGQPMELQEVLVDDLGTETWLRFRFVAPEIAREGGSVTYATAEPDFMHLCETLALPYITEFALEGDVIVISLADRPTEFGTADREATQFFEAFRPVDNTCIWEGL